MVRSGVDRAGDGALLETRETTGEPWTRASRSASRIWTGDDSSSEAPGEVLGALESNGARRPSEALPSSKAEEESVEGVAIDETISRGGSASDGVCE